MTNITHRLLNHWQHKSDEEEEEEETETNTNPNSTDDNSAADDETKNHKRRMHPILIYATTTPFMPLAQKGIMIVDKLNEIARDVMKNVSNEGTAAATTTTTTTTAKSKITILDMNKLVHDHCGVLYEDCDWCRKSPCSYHYNTAGMSNQGMFASIAIRKALLRQPLQLLQS